MKKEFLSFFVLLQSSLSVIAAEEAISFDAQIKPIFDKHCIECHEGWFPSGGLRLDSIENIRKGGKTGFAIVPGKADKGLIIMSVVPRKNGRVKMPPMGERLHDEEIELIREWIRQGAK